MRMETTIFFVKKGAAAFHQGNALESRGVLNAELILYKPKLNGQLTKVVLLHSKKCKHPCTMETFLSRSSSDQLAHNKGRAKPNQWTYRKVFREQRSILKMCSPNHNL